MRSWQIRGSIFENGSQGVKVNVPPFVNQSGLFTEEEMLATRRIHGERAIERIKNYHILGFIPTTICKSGLIDIIFGRPL